MNEVPLSDEENRLILTERFGKSLRALDDKSRQLRVLNRIHALLDSVHPQHFIYETLTGTDKLQIIRAGDDLRIYCRLVMGVPEDDKLYNVLYCFHVTPHQYGRTDLGQFDSVAKAKMKKLKGYEQPREVTRYLDEEDAFSAADLKERIDRA